MVMGVPVLCGVEKARCVPLLCSDTTDGFCSLYPAYPFKETAAQHEGDAKSSVSFLTVGLMLNVEAEEISLGRRFMTARY